MLRSASRSEIWMEMETWTSSPRETSQGTSGTGMVSFGLEAMGKEAGPSFRRAVSRAKVYRQFTPSGWQMWITMDSLRLLRCAAAIMAQSRYGNGSSQYDADGHGMAP